MAKVMVSVPDDLLQAVDAEAARRGTTRSGLLRRFADEALRHRAGARAARIEEVMRDSVAHGGNSAEVLKRHRPRTVTTWLADASVVLAREDIDDAHHDDARRFLGGPHPVATVDLASTR